jgi:hypothetical protein
MKKQIIFSALLLVLIGLSIENLFSSSSANDDQTTKDIILKGLGSSHGTRSSPLSPNITAFIEDGVLEISFHYALGNDPVTIRISDEFSEVIYENEVIVNESMTVSIPLDSESSGEYLLEISSLNFYLYGDF